MSSEFSNKKSNYLLVWKAPELTVLNISYTSGKSDPWANEGGQGAGDRCTNPDNPNYNPTGWVCTNRGPS